MKSRYITRTNDIIPSSSSNDSSEKQTLDRFFPHCNSVEHLKQTITQLYPYKDLIGYNSKIIYFTRVVRNELVNVHGAFYNISYEYKITDNDALEVYQKYITKDNNVVSTTHFSYLLPYALLVTKDDEIIPISVSYEYLHLLNGEYGHNCNAHPSVEGVYPYIYDIDEIIVCLDHDYDESKQKIHDYHVPDEYVDFISVEKPSLKHFFIVRAYKAIHDERILTYVSSIKNDILRDYGLEGYVVDAKVEVKYNYVSNSSLEGKTDENNRNEHTNANIDEKEHTSDASDEEPKRNTNEKDHTSDT